MSQVIIDDILPYTQAIATGGQTVFSTDWTANYASDVVVYSRPVLSTPDDTVDELPSNAFNVAFIGGSEIVQVTLVTPALAGDIVTITRMTPADRVNLYTNTNFTPSMLNNDFGILTLVDQQAQLVNQRIAPRYNYSAIIKPWDIILPQLGAGESWVMNGSGDEIIAAVAGGGSSDVLAQLASHSPGEGASLVGLNPVGTVQDLANAKFILQQANTAAPNAQSLGALTTGIVKNTTTTGVLSISAPLTSIDGLTTAADQMLYTTAANTYATTGLTAFMRTVLDDSTAAAAAATLLVLPLAGGTMTGAINMGTHLINGVVDPVSAQDAATKNYVDNVLTSGFLPLTGGTMLAPINMGGFKIVNMADPTLNQDAVTLAHLNTQLVNYLLKSGGTMTGAINMNSHFITGLLDPVNPQDAATRAYVDLVAAGLSVQPSCVAASTVALTVTYNNGASGIGATLTNAGAFAVFALDGTNPTATQRVLIWNQANPIQNGIYTVTNVGNAISVNWVLTRATDYDQPSEIQPGDLVIITAGSTYAGSSFVETQTVTAIGTDPINFSQFTFSATAVLLKANNLSDVASVTTSFNNISPSTTKGDLITNDGTNDVRQGVGGNGTLLQANSGVTNGIQWTTATYPTTTTVSEILYSSAGNVISGLATTNGGVLVTNNTGVPSMLANPAAVGRILQSANAAISTWSSSSYPSGAGTAGKLPISDGTNFILSTSIWPNTVGTVGKIIRSDGTVNAYSTATFADTYAASTLLYSNGANTVAGLATANSAVLVTGNTGVPVWSGTMTNGQLIMGVTSGTPVANTLTAGSGITITNGAGTITVSSTSGGIAWSNVAGTTQAAAVDSGYIIGNAAQTTVTLPAIAPIGSTVKIQGKGAGGWIMKGNTGQVIRFASQVTSSAGTLTSTNRYDSVEAIAITADTEWSVSIAVSTGLTVA